MKYFCHALTVLLSVFLFCTFGFLSWAAPFEVPANLPLAPGARELNLLLRHLAVQRAEIINIQRELVLRPALNPEDGGEGEEAKALWIESWLREKGLPQAERFDVPDARVPAKIRPNLIIRWPGTTQRTLWIIGHLDTALPGAETLWTGSPWALRIDGDTLYGRGVEDNHQAISTGLVLLQALVSKNIIPPTGLGLIFTSGEKSGFPRAYGLDALLLTRPDLIGPGDLVVVNDYGNERGTSLEVSEKGLLWLNVTVIGQQAHSASPEKGINALSAGAALIGDLNGLHKLFPQQNSLFVPPFSTFVPTNTRSSGSGINQVPGEFVFSLDCRLVAPLTVDAVEQEVRALADAVEEKHGVRVQVERVRTIPAFNGTAQNAPVVLAMQRAVRGQWQRKAIAEGIGGVTLAADLRARGIAAVVWANTPSKGLDANEKVSVSALLEAAQVFARVLFDELDEGTANSVVNTGKATVQ